MNVLKISCFICLLYSFSSCNEQIQISYEKLAQMPVGFVSNKNSAGVFYDRQSKQELMYFLKGQGEQNLRFFDFAGKLIDSIPLEQSVNLKRYFNPSIKSRDSFILQSAGTTDCGFDCFNGSGRLVKQFLINNLIDSNNVKSYTFSALSLGFENPNNIFVHTDLYRSTKIKFTDRALDEYAFFTDLYNANIEEFQMVNIRNILNDDTTKVSTKQFGRMYKNILKIKHSEKMISDNQYGFFVNKKYFVKSNYVDGFLIYDPISLKFERKLTIKSKFTTIGGPMQSLRRDNVSQMRKAEGKISKYGSIMGLYFNQNSECYYTVILKKCEKPEFSNVDYDVPFVIQKYDKDFNLLGEVEGDNSKINYDMIFMTKDGLIGTCFNYQKGLSNKKPLQFYRIKF